MMIIKSIFGFKFFKIYVFLVYIYYVYMLILYLQIYYQHIYVYFLLLNSLNYYPLEVFGFEFRNKKKSIVKKHSGINPKTHSEIPEFHSGFLDLIPEFHSGFLDLFRNFDSGFLDLIPEFITQFSLFSLKI